MKVFFFDYVYKFYKNIVGLGLWDEYIEVKEIWTFWVLLYHFII